MKLALAQANFTVGDIAGNTAKIKTLWQQAESQGADLVIFPEMTITGYPVEDLALVPAFRSASMAALEDLKTFSTSLKSAAIIGGMGEARKRGTNNLYVLEAGKLLHEQAKVALPNYGVFDEKRHFRSGKLPAPLHWRGIRLGLMICEDHWQSYFSEHLAKQGVDLFIAINGSPFETSKTARRHEVGKRVVTTHHAPLIYVNMIAGQDEVVMEGASYVMDAAGDILHQLPSFEESLTLVEYPLKTPATRHSPLATHEKLYRAMQLGLHDYVKKSGFTDVVIGLSGGIDSALTAAIAVDALGKEHVHLVYLPSPYSSEKSSEDAAECAHLLGVELQTIPIAPMIQVMEESLAPLFLGRAPDITEENIQSRIRGNLLMALSNKFGWMLITTGNKSEMATGYATLYGDMCGGYNPLKDLYKTDVFAVSRWRNTQSPVMPERVITKPPSAELRPNQTDQDSLPPYDILDAILERLIEQHQSPAEIIAAGFDSVTVNKVATLLHRAEYKRRQAALGAKLTPTAFGRDWRMPLVNQFKG